MKKLKVSELIELVEQGKTYNEISSILGIGKSTISYHCKKNGIKSKYVREAIPEELEKEVADYYTNHTTKETCAHFSITDNTVKNCAKKFGVSKKSGERQTFEERRANGVKAVSKRRRVIKEKAIEYKGGRCMICGYNKSNWSLSFHHRNPEEKDFSISIKGNCKSWDKLKVELDKCDLLCHNCHGEVHEKLSKIKSLH